jgi:hypothetical protein
VVRHQGTDQMLIIVRDDVFPCCANSAAWGAQFRGERDRIGYLHAAQLFDDRADGQECSCRHGSFPMIETGVRTVMITARVVPAPSPGTACRRSSASACRDSADGGDGDDEPVKQMWRTQLKPEWRR